MSRREFFLAGPLHGMGRPAEGEEPGTTYEVEADDGQTHHYRVVQLVIAGKPRDVFVLEGYDLELAQREAARFEPAFKSH